MSHRFASVLSVAVIILSLAGPVRAAGASSISIRDSAGNCGSCCTTPSECVQWCEESNCPGNCELFSNPMCCEEGMGIQCAR